MSIERKKWNILDGVEFSDPEELEELGTLGALIEDSGYTLDGKELPNPDSELEDAEHEAAATDIRYSSEDVLKAMREAVEGSARI